MVVVVVDISVVVMLKRLFPIKGQKNQATYVTVCLVSWWVIKIVVIWFLCDSLSLRPRPTTHPPMTGWCGGA